MQRQNKPAGRGRGQIGLEHDVPVVVVPDVAGEAREIRVLHADGKVVQRAPGCRGNIEGDGGKRASAADFVGQVKALGPRRMVVIAQREGLGRGAGADQVGAGAGGGTEGHAAVEIRGDLAGKVERGYCRDERRVHVLRRGDGGPAQSINISR